jgi:hypothetical protein
MVDSGRRDGVGKLLAEITGSAEEAARIADWAREQVKVETALLGDGHMSNSDRRRILATELRRISDDCADHRMMLNGLADLIEPEGGGVQALDFVNRRAGNPKAKNDIEDAVIAMEANRLYRKYIAEGRRRRGLKKRVSDEIGRWSGKAGSTIDRLWRPLPPNKPLRDVDLLYKRKCTRR